MRYDDEIMGDEIVGEILDGEEVGDEIVGDELGDDVLGEDYHLVAGDEIMGDDLLGDESAGDDLLGDRGDMGAIFGRRRRRRRQQAERQRLLQLQRAQAEQRARERQRDRQAALRNAIMARRLANAKLVVHKKPTKNRVQSIGFNFSQVGPGATVDIPARPQVKFRGTRLSIPTSIAPNFLIEDLKVGRNSQFVAAGAQAAETFKDTATAENVAMDTADPGMDIILSVTNTTGTPADFHGTLFGDAVE